MRSLLLMTGRTWIIPEKGLFTDRAPCYKPESEPVINLTTTLLADVDASLGGKTGVNHFYQPEPIYVVTG